MAKNLLAKCKQCRRVNQKLFLKGERCQTVKCAMVKRAYPPGFHGPNQTHKKTTDYGTQLSEKQKCRKQYQLLEKQFRLTFDKAQAKQGNAGENMLQLLETRLDNVIFRAGLAESRGQARQLVSHGHFVVNDKKAQIPSMILKVGDKIEIKNNKKTNKYFRDMSEALKKKEIPGWLHMDKKNIIIKVLHLPDMKMINPNFNVQMIVEFYSR